MEITAARPVLALVLLITVSAAAQAAAFELWNEEPPELPVGARTVTAYRTVMVRNAVQQDAEPHKYEQIDLEDDGVVVRRLYDSQGDFLWEAIFEYENHRLTQIRAVDTGERWRLAFEYDAEGRVMRERYFAGNRAPERTIVYRYGEQTTEVISYRADGSVDWRRTDTAGDAPGERRKVFYYGDGTRFKTIIVVYDENGTAVAERHFDEVGATYQRVERSLAGDRKIEESVWNGGNALVRHTIWQYDHGGRLVARFVRVPEDGREERLLINYRMNERGHWVERLETAYAQFEGEPAFVTDRVFKERRIEYVDAEDPAESADPLDTTEPGEPAEPADAPEPAEPVGSPLPVDSAEPE